MIHMETITHPHISISFEHRQQSESVITRFFRWCEGQQPNRLLWLGVAVSAQGCILAPATILAIVLGGVSLPLFIAAIVAMAMVLVTNLAALPTKITVPVFFFSILIDIVLVVIAALQGFDIAKTYI